MVQSSQWTPVSNIKDQSLPSPDRVTGHVMKNAYLRSGRSGVSVLMAVMEAASEQESF